MTKWLLSLDVTSVLVFVIAGRNTHGSSESAAGVLHTAAPFLIALVFGWAIVRAWNHPLEIRTGLAVAVATVAVGISLRHIAFDYGVALSFQIVALAFITTFMIGWRLVALGALRWAHRRSGD